MILEFEGYRLEMRSFELRHDGEQIAVEPQVLEILAYLIANRDRVVSKDELFDEVWKGRIVSLSALTTRINAARTAVGDSGAEQRLIRTVARKGYRFVGEVTEVAASPAKPPRLATPVAAARHIQFCRSTDGVGIAYASVGQGPPLVKAGNWLNHLDHDWESPIWSHVLHWLAEGRRFIRYDARGNGLSDWNAPEISLDAFVRDLETVVDAAGLERFSLLGISQGCPVSILYAVRHPERVEKLVLYGGFARGRAARGNEADKEQAAAMVTLMRTGWGQDNPVFRQMFTSHFVPGATAEQVDWFNNLQRITTSPENAARIRLVSDHLDIADVLGMVKAPTLVLHCRDDAVQPFEQGRLLASGIPGAEFVALEGRNHLILETDPCWSRFQSEVAAFLAC